MNSYQPCYKSSKILQNFKHKDLHNLPYLKFQSSFSRSHVIRIAKIFNISGSKVRQEMQPTSFVQMLTVEFAQNNFAKCWTVF
jgi:hypothetical protein